MSDGVDRRPVVMKTRGAYRGAFPGWMLGPPPKTPSGSVPAPTPKKKRKKKAA